MRPSQNPPSSGHLHGKSSAAMLGGRRWNGRRPVEVVAQHFAYHAGADRASEVAGSRLRADTALTELRSARVLSRRPRRKASSVNPDEAVFFPFGG